MFEKFFYHEGIMGWTSCFLEVTETSSVHSVEMNCRSICKAFYCIYPKIWKIQKCKKLLLLFKIWIMCPKAVRMTNTEYPDQTAPSAWSVSALFAQTCLLKKLG